MLDFFIWTSIVPTQMLLSLQGAFYNSLSQVFEHSIEAGFPLLVENMPEHIDAVLQPVTLQGLRWYRMVLHIGWLVVRI